jgi:hypothetical protein
MGNPYFGPYWSAPATDDAPHVDTPVGGRCIGCDEVVVQGDQGFVMGCYQADRTVIYRPIHRECELLELVGHSYGICSCNAYDGTENRRTGALLLWNKVQQRLSGRWEVV